MAQGVAVFRLDIPAALPSVAGTKIKCDSLLKYRLREGNAPGILRLDILDQEQSVVLTDCQDVSSLTLPTDKAGLEKFFESSLDTTAQGPREYAITSAVEAQERRGIGLPHASVLQAGTRLLSTVRHFPGIHTSYAYRTIKGVTFFGLHLEDFKLQSLNLLYDGAPKLWLIVYPQDKDKLEHRLWDSLRLDSNGEAPRNRRPQAAEPLCAQFVRHLGVILKPSLLRHWKIRFSIKVQAKGDMMFILPGAYHQGINLGANLAEAINTTTDEDWTVAPMYRACGPQCPKESRMAKSDMAIKPKEDVSPATPMTVQVQLRESRSLQSAPSRRTIARPSSTSASKPPATRPQILQSNGSIPRKSIRLRISSMSGAEPPPTTAVQHIHPETISSPILQESEVDPLDDEDGSSVAEAKSFSDLETYPLDQHGSVSGPETSRTSSRASGRASSRGSSRVSSTSKVSSRASSRASSRVSSKTSIKASSTASSSLTSTATSVVLSSTRSGNLVSSEIDTCARDLDTAIATAAEPVSGDDKIPAQRSSIDLKPATPRTEPRIAESNVVDAKLNLPVELPTPPIDDSIAQIDRLIGWALEHHETFEWPSGATSSREILEHQLRRFNPLRGSKSWLTDMVVMESLWSLQQECKGLVVVDSALVKKMAESDNDESIPDLQDPRETVVAPYYLESSKHWALIVVRPDKGKIETQASRSDPVCLALGRVVNRTLDLEVEYQIIHEQVRAEVAPTNTNGRKLTWIIANPSGRGRRWNQLRYLDHPCRRNARTGSRSPSDRSGPASPSVSSEGPATDDGQRGDGQDVGELRQKTKEGLRRGNERAVQGVA